MRYHSYLHVHKGTGEHKFNAEYRQPCRYCNEYKGSHFEFTYLNDSLVVPYCSKKCFIEDGNTLESNEYTQFVDQWIESGGRNRAIEEQQLSDKQYQERRKIDEQQEIAEKNKKAKNNRLLQFIVFAIVIGGLGYYFFLYNPYSSEQMSNACDCVENSYENTGIAADNLPYEEQKKRSYCFDLFKPEDFKLLEDDLQEIYENMEKACEKSR
jgi:hypothetical protein